MGNSKKTATQQLTLRQNLLQKLVVVLFFALLGTAWVYYQEYALRERSERFMNHVTSEIQSGKTLHEIDLKAD